MRQQERAPWDGQRLRRLRDNMGVTQRDLASVLQVYTKTIAAAEGGRKPIPQRCEPWLEILERAVAIYESTRSAMRDASEAFIDDWLGDDIAPTEPRRLFRHLRVEHGVYPVPSFWHGALSPVFQQRARSLPSQ